MTEFDRGTIRTHFYQLHEAAKRANVPDGKLCLAMYGQDPETDETFKSVEHFAIGDIEAMTNAAMAFDKLSHRNVYAPLVVLKPETRPGNRREIDIAAVIGFVIDGDADKGRQAPTPPLPADYIVESSTGNLQHFLFLYDPLPRGDAKQFAAALKRATGADCADEIGHVWRVPGCLNWPNAAKIKRGRSREPQPVRVHQPWTKWTSSDALRTALAANWQKSSQDSPLASQSDRNVCPIKALEFHVRLRDAGHYDAGPDARRRYIHAAKALSFDLGDEGRKIWEEVVCWNGTRGDDEGEAVTPNEAAARWRDCSGLRPGVKPVSHGTLIEDAKQLYGWTGLYLERPKTAAEMFAGKVAGTADSPAHAPPATDQREFLLNSAAFVRGFIPPDYLVDGIFQKGFFYSITAKTGVGKTAAIMRIGAHVAVGWKIGDLDVMQGTVLYLAGENPTDIRMRWLGLSKAMGFDPDAVPVHFIDGVVSLSQTAELITAEVVRKQLSLSLVIVDTAAAFNEGDEENSNAQAGEYARRLRSLTKLPGNPCVIVLAHPAKNANDEELVPRGGSAFIAEVDGNVGLRKKDTTIAASVAGKFRGPDFPPVYFELITIRDHPKLRDTRGRQIPTVVARPISADEQSRLDQKGRSDDDAILSLLCDRPGLNPTDIARALDWYLRATNGKEPAPYHAKATRRLEVMEKQKLVEQRRGNWFATPKAQRDLNAIVSTGK